MSRYAYVNGRFVPHARAAVHIEDRGYQFADAVYEVWSVVDGQLYDEDGHFERLVRSLSALGIPLPRSRPALTCIIRELLRRNRIRNGLVYLQVSRGVARRDHAPPVPQPAPAIVLTAKPLDLDAQQARSESGVAVITQPDIRWGRCDIKTTNLLPNVLAKQAAHQAGAGECWLVDGQGLVTEGSSTNAWIVDARGVLRTRQADNKILHGITRARVMACARETGVDFEERPFTADEVAAAQEAFMTSASTFVLPVISIDGHVIGTGAPGALTMALRKAYKASQ